MTELAQSLTTPAFMDDVIKEVVVEQGVKVLKEELSPEEGAAAIMEGDMSVVTSYMQQYLRDVIAGVATLEPSVDSEFTVNCEKLAVEAGGKQKVAWLPADMNQFASQVETALYQ